MAVTKCLDDACARYLAEADYEDRVLLARPRETEDDAFKKGWRADSKRGMRVDVLEEEPQLVSIAISLRESVRVGGRATRKRRACVGNQMVIPAVYADNLLTCPDCARLS
jgi:hypothetical protein